MPRLLVNAGDYTRVSEAAAPASGSVTVHYIIGCLHNGHRRAVCCSVPVVYRTPVVYLITPNVVAV
jgi:hypothetical protein